MCESQNDNSHKSKVTSSATKNVASIINLKEKEKEQTGICNLIDELIEDFLQKKQNLTKQYQVLEIEKNNEKYEKC
eukprot:Pgem_evm1s6930